jgi:hypothetical protein
VNFTYVTKEKTTLKEIPFICFTAGNNFPRRRWCGSAAQIAILVKEFDAVEKSMRLSKADITLNPQIYFFSIT